VSSRPNERNEAGGVWRLNRARNRQLGLDRFGRPLPRVAGTNPRALGTNPRETRRRGVKWVSQWANG